MDVRRVEPLKVYDDYDINVPDVSGIGGEDEAYVLPEVQRGGAVVPPLTGENWSDYNVVPETASTLAAIGASSFSTGRAWKKYLTGENIFEPDLNFDAQKYAADWFKTNGQLSEHEVQYLNQAVRLEDAQYRASEIIDQRERASAMQDNTLGTFIGALMDVDVGASFIPYAGQVRLGTKAAYSAGLGAAAGAITYTNPNDIRTDLEKAFDPFMFGIGAMFGSTLRTARSAAPVPKVAETVIDESGTVTKAVDDVMEDVVVKADIPKATDDVVQDFKIKGGTDDVINGERVVKHTETTGKHKYVTRIYDNVGNVLASVAYSTKGAYAKTGAVVSISDVVPQSAQMQVLQLVQNTAKSQGAKLPQDIVPVVQNLGVGTKTVQGTPKVQPTPQMQGTSPVYTPMTPLSSGVGSVSTNKGIQTILNHQAQQVQQAGGSMGTVQALGVTLPVPLPISQPVRQIEVPTFYQKTFGKWFESSGQRLIRMSDGVKDSGTKSTLKRLLADPSTQGDNAVYLSHTVRQELDAAFRPVEEAIAKATKERFGTSGWSLQRRREHLDNMQVVQREFLQSIQLLDKRNRDALRAGVTLTDDDLLRMLPQGTHKSTEDIVSTYMNSKFAEKAYDHMRNAGLLTDELATHVHRRNTYFPVRHSPDNLDQVMKQVSDPDLLYTFIGRQIMAQYPTIQGKKFSLTAKQLGMHFYRTQMETRSGIQGVRSTGMTADSIRELLKGTGLSAREIEDVVAELIPQVEQSGQSAVKNLRSRIDWQWDAHFTDPKTGTTFTMGDLIDHDAILTALDYSRSISSRVGLAHYGIRTVPELEAILQEALHSRPVDMYYEVADQFLTSVRSSLLGLPTGEKLHPVARTLNTLAGSMVLATGGIWQLMDLATQVFKIGLVRTVPEISEGLKHSFRSLKGLPETELTRLEDILLGRLSNDGRWRNSSMRYDDNFSVASGIHETVNFLGQSTRYVNFTESIKRMQQGIAVGAIVSAFEGAAKGSAADIKYLKTKFKFSDSLVQEVAAEYKANGAAIDMWTPRTRLAMEQKVFYEVDNLAYTIRDGELPSFMEHTTWGKVIFPFLSFTMSMQQKLLRNTFTRDGATGLAAVALFQLPLAVMLGAIANVKDGKEPDEDIIQRALMAASVTGMWNIPLSMLQFNDDGEFNGIGQYRGGSNIFTPYNKWASAYAAITDDNASTYDVANSIRGATPFVGAMTPLQMAISVLKED